LDNVRVTIDIELGVSLLNIPELDGEIGGGGGENVAGNWVEVDGSDLSLVSGEGLNWGGDGGGGSQMEYCLSEVLENPMEKSFSLLPR
jgi:hypothetical protein